MKNLFFISCALLFFPPQGETATAVRPLPDIKNPIIVPGQRPSAFKPVPLRSVGRCGALCIEQASPHLSPEAIKALNRSQFQESLETKTADTLALMPAVSAKLSLVFNSSQVQATTSSFVGAIIESPRWNDPVAQAEIFSLVESIATEGVNGRKKQLEQIEKDCAI